MPTRTSGLIPTRVMAGTNTRNISITPPVEASPDYADGDVIGGKMVLANAARSEGGRSGNVVQAHVYSLVNIAASVPIRVILFNSDPDASTFTENSALSIASADLSKILGVINLDQRLDLGTPVMLYAGQPIVLPFDLADEAVLHAVAVAGGAINLAGTSDLTFHFGIHQD